jgi:hypothetical protein
MWITLWATGRDSPQSREMAGLATDCLTFEQAKILENQWLA